MIADEAHYLKSQLSKRSKSLVSIMSHAKRVLLLTGTPMLGKPNEIYNLIKIVRPDIFCKFMDYGARYCAPRESIYGIDWSGSANKNELHLMLEKSLMIRRLK
jgi:SWI/SNF-related matrix-associated actin-dependent regulator 1 of chromatin subfamily A